MATKFDFLQFIMNPKKWWIPITFIFMISTAGVVWIGYETYYEAPPIPTYITEDGKIVFSVADILKGQAVFQKHALMEYGSMFGDGANRGPDFTAQALHQVSILMNLYYTSTENHSELEKLGINQKVKDELKHNRYDESTNQVTLTQAQVYAAQELITFYKKFFTGKIHSSSSLKSDLNNDTEIKDLTAFFFWGSWVCSSARLGHTYSYTHNWPFDIQAGNSAEAPVVLWTAWPYPWTRYCSLLPRKTR